MQRRHGRRAAGHASCSAASGEKLEAAGEGDGMIDAACQAIKAATGVDGTLTDFNVSSVTGGVDALAT